MTFKSKKYIIGGLISTLMLFGVAVPAIASSPKGTSLLGQDWRIWNRMPATNSYWDINQAKTNSLSGAVEFPFPMFDTTTTGSFAAYLQTHYNTDLTGKTITANVTWSPGSYMTYNGGVSYVRIEFQDVASGPYNMNDYWFYTGSLDLNAGSGGNLTASLTTPGLWTNLCGKTGADPVIYTGTDCVGGNSSLSPAAGFAAAMKNVKSVSLAFGNTTTSEAAGVAAVGTTAAIFDMSTFTIG